jgi:hypothetical protein
MVSMLRLENENLNPNAGAQSLDNSGMAEAAAVRKAIEGRAGRVKDTAAGSFAERMAAERIDKWVKESVKPGRRLGYEAMRRQGDLVGLLKKPGAAAWDEFTVPMSMREVEPGVQLIMDDAKQSGDPPGWKFRAVKSDGGDA